MTHSRKLIFFDIDGTLLTEGAVHTVPESTTLALAQLRAAGHLCLINTGRPWAALDAQIRSIRVDGYVCGCGTHIRLGDEILLAHHIPARTCARIVRLLDAAGVDWLLEGGSGLYYPDRPCPTRLGAQIASMRGKLPETMRAIGREAYDRVGFDKFIMVLPDGADAAPVFEALAAEMTFIDRGGRMYEVVPKPFSKASGMRFLEERFGVDNADTIAVGDSANDVSMLEYAGTGILMGGADPALHRFADIVTAPIGEDGLYLAFREMGLI